MSDSNTSQIILGCFVAVVSSAIQSLGITLQRRSHLIPIHTTDIHDNSHHIHQKYKRNMWLFGFFLFIIANVLGSLIQISTLPLIILSPLQSIGLIFNSLLSCLLLPGETFTYKLGMGTFVISIGAFIIAYNGNATPLPPPEDLSPNKKFTIILNKLLRPGFLVWFIFTFVLISLLLLTNVSITFKRNKLKETLKYRQSKSLIRYLDKLKFTRGINFGLISGTLTAHTFLFAKSLIDVIVETIMNEKNSLGIILTSSNITPYVLLIIMLMIVGFQLTAFNLALSQISTSILYPLCFLVYNMMNLLNDLIFNSLISNHRMTVGQLIWVVFGLTGVLIGVVLISWDSAVGSNNIKHFPCIKSEDDYILHTKFPYTDHKVNDDTPLLELDSSFNSYDSNYLHPNVYPSRQHSKKKRILSFEQKQLLEQLDL
ncbi:hypothetical protein CLIB1444_02S09494 [[Candida] jaroonii]|uniref:Uncharacterized protein n=1 Tax=[Candida] jaroonii TaxID=467808 RepID=A0ACA9Y3Z8_9ASCO|nr:hypothetical protein CLIB1444_02S09494 [[Candida] jaroonii]